MENQINEEISKKEPLILDELMKQHSYFPENKDFEIKNKEIEDNNNFVLIFKEFIKYLRNFDSNLTNLINKSNKKIEHHLKNTIINSIFINNTSYDIEIKEYIKYYWIHQKEYNIRHTVLFLVFTDKYIQDISDKKFSEYDKNIIYWAILFHDLGKHQNMNPLIKEKININMADNTHPFKSVIIFLNIAFEKNLFYYQNEKYKDDLVNYYKNDFSNSLYKSWKLERDKKHRRDIYNISYDYIDIFEKFFYKIKEEEKNEWIYDVCVLIIFHQSLPINEKKMNKPLEEKYIKIFFTKRLIELMRVVMIYDSASHSLFNGGKWPHEINNHLNGIVKLFN